MHMERAWRPNNFPAWVLEFRSATCCCRLNTNLVMLLVADNKTVFLGVYITNPGLHETRDLLGADKALWQASGPGQLRHRRGGGAVRPGVAGGAGGGAEGYSSAAEERARRPRQHASRRAGRGSNGAHAARADNKTQFSRRRPWPTNMANQHHSNNKCTEYGTHSR